MRLVLLIIFLLMNPAAAQKKWKVLIQTDPTGAEIRRYNDVLGVSGTPFYITEKSYSQGDLAISIHLEDYEVAETLIQGSVLNIDTDITHPSTPIVLKPKYFFVPWKRKPLIPLLVLASIIGVGFAGYRIRRGEQEIKQRAERTSMILKDTRPDPYKMAGKIVGSHLLVELLGEGGMAVVYRAVPEDEPDSNKFVAIKLLHPNTQLTEEHKARFIREAQVTRDLDHPNIVRVFIIDDHLDMQYIGLEFIDGQPISKYIPEGGYSFEEALPYFEQILGGLVYAHDKGLVHRDLKPGNVMLTKANQIKIMDFGLARRREVDKTITATGSFLGTPGYMAPEQMAEEVDPRSDQYSLGAMFHEMLTGRLPFEDTDPLKLIVKCFKEEIPDPRTHKDSIPEGMAEFIQRLMKINPDERYADMAEAQRAFKKSGR